ncbi:MAG: DUF1585 domain-containing protein, partial [Acidobacteriota bacterium]|nr:DUF1585 domain-containing protein [Acidobacteriota bacterium]
RKAAPADADPKDDAAIVKEGKRRFSTNTVNLDLDTSGNVAGIPDSQFSSPAELGAVLAKSAQCQECVVKQYFRYTAGRLETPADRPLIAKVFEDFRRSQFHFRDLIVSLTVQREFPNEEGTANVASNHKSR